MVGARVGASPCKNQFGNQETTLGCLLIISPVSQFIFQSCSNHIPSKVEMIWYVYLILAHYFTENRCFTESSRRWKSSPLGASGWGNPRFFPAIQVRLAWKTPVNVVFLGKSSSEMRKMPVPWFAEGNLVKFLRCGWCWLVPFAPNHPKHHESH